MCNPGWMGANCDKSCYAGYFGVQCVQKCQCFGNVKCNSESGEVSSFWFIYLNILNNCYLILISVIARLVLLD